MSKPTIVVAICLLMVSCTTENKKDESSGVSMPQKDTLTYAFKPTYSSQISVPGDPLNAQKVLAVWKMFESGKIAAMRPYFADSVNYDDARGMHFHGSADTLLAYANGVIAQLDSLRFDITAWQSAHVNDKNEDWVNIWAVERRYPKNRKADTINIQENWRLKDGKIVYFDQYTAKP